MSAQIRFCTLLVGVLAALGGQGCRDVGLVGEGSACAEGCPSGSTCMSGVCVPVLGGAAGDEAEHEDEEREDEEHEEEEQEEEPPPP